MSDMRSLQTICRNLPPSLKQCVIFIGFVDFVCTLVFGCITPFVYQDTWATFWCIVILCCDISLIHGAKGSNNKFLVIWLTIYSLNIIFFLLLLAIIPMMVVAIYLGNNAIANCFRNEQVKKEDNEWTFKTTGDIHLDCSQANDFFLGLKGIMYIFMTIITILPIYYIFAWITVNRLRCKNACSPPIGYQRIPES